MEIFEYFWKFLNICGHSKKILDILLHSLTFLDISGHSRTFLDILDISGHILDISGQILEIFDPFPPFKSDYVIYGLYLRPTHWKTL